MHHNNLSSRKVEAEEVTFDYSDENVSEGLDVQAHSLKEKISTSIHELNRMY